jgi:serine/threonine protein kinase
MIDPQVGAKYFDPTLSKLKTSEEFALDANLPSVDVTKRYVKERTLEGVIKRCEDKRRPRIEPVHSLSPQQLNGLVDFCSGVLQMDPALRWTAQQAKLHPFVAQMEDEVEMEEEEEEVIFPIDMKRTAPISIHSTTTTTKSARKMSEIGSPFISSVHQSPIFRPDNVNPFGSSGESFTSPRMFSRGGGFPMLPPSLVLPASAASTIKSSSSWQEQTILQETSEEKKERSGGVISKSLAKWAPFDGNNSSKQQQQQQQQEE